MSAEVEAYLAALPPNFRAAAETLRAQLPDHIECLSYAMPGFREPMGRMIAGYSAPRHHLGLSPHSGNVIPPAPIAKIIRARQAEIAQ